MIFVFSNLCDADSVSAYLSIQSMENDLNDKVAASMADPGQAEADLEETTKEVDRHSECP